MQSWQFTLRISNQNPIFQKPVGWRRAAAYSFFNPENVQPQLGSLLSEMLISSYIGTFIRDMLSWISCSWCLCFSNNKNGLRQGDLSLPDVGESLVEAILEDISKVHPIFLSLSPLASVSSTAITCTCCLDIRTKSLTYILGWFDSFPIQTFLWFPFCVRWWQVSWNQCFQFLPKTNCTISSSHCPKSAPGENRECPKFIMKSCHAISVTWLLIIKVLDKKWKYY